MSDFLKSITQFLGPEIVSMWAYGAGWNDSAIVKFLELLELQPPEALADAPDFYDLPDLGALAEGFEQPERAERPSLRE